MAMDWCRMGMCRSRVIPLGHTSVAGIHGLILLWSIPHGYITIKSWPWIVDVWTWIGCESAMDCCVGSGKPWTGHVLGQESRCLDTDKALCRPYKPSLVPGHGSVLCPLVKPWASPMPGRLPATVLDTRASSCARRFRPIPSLVPIKLGHEPVIALHSVPMPMFSICAWPLMHAT